MALDGSLHRTEALTRRAIIPCAWTPRDAWRSSASCARSRAGSPGPTPSGARRTGSRSVCASCGRRAEIEPTYVHPQWALVHALHCLLALAGSLVALECPPLGFALVLLAAISMYLDLNARFYLLRRLFFRRASQNVVSRGTHAGRARAPRSSARTTTPPAAARVYDAERARRLARLGAALPAAARPDRASSSGRWRCSLPIIGARMAGVEADRALAPPAPPHARAPARHLRSSSTSPSPTRSPAPTTTPRASRPRSRSPSELERRAARATSTSGSCSPAARRPCRRACARSCAPTATQLDRELRPSSSTSTPSAPATSASRPPQGWAVSYQMDRRLIELCAAIADARRSERRSVSAPSPLRHGYAATSLPPRLAGFRATTITCLRRGRLRPRATHPPDDVPDAIDPGALERAHDFALELVRRLDRDVGRRAELTTTPSVACAR